MPLPTPHFQRVLPATYTGPSNATRKRCPITNFTNLSQRRFQPQHRPNQNPRPHPLPRTQPPPTPLPRRPRQPNRRPNQQHPHQPLNIYIPLPTPQHPRHRPRLPQHRHRHRAPRPRHRSLGPPLRSPPPPLPDDRARDPGPRHVGTTAQGTRFLRAAHGRVLGTFEPLAVYERLAAVGGWVVC